MKTPFFEYICCGCDRRCVQVEQFFRIRKRSEAVISLDSSTFVCNYYPECSLGCKDF
jgi:hypothetical protein